MKILMIIAALMLLAGIILGDVILGTFGVSSLAFASATALADRSQRPHPVTRG